MTADASTRTGKPTKKTRTKIERVRPLVFQYSQNDVHHLQPLPC